MNAAIATIPSEKIAVLDKLRALKPLVKNRYRITLLGLFGSVARGEQRPGSDLDVLIKLDKGASIMDWSALRLFLIDIFGCEVDLADSENLRDSYKPFIFKDFISL